MAQHYPTVLQKEENKDVYFKLKCRKFTEMVLKINQQHTQNGSAGNGAEDLDGPKAPELDNVDRIAELKRINGKSSASLNAMDVDQDDAQPQPMANGVNVLDTLAIVEYGKALGEEFENDTRPEVKHMLDVTFAPIAHLNTPNAALDELVDSKGRAELAEQINGAILGESANSVLTKADWRTVSQGKPRDAVLNTYCGQTQVMLDMLSSAKGGPATMINVQKDFLQEPGW